MKKKTDKTIEMLYNYFRDSEDLTLEHQDVLNREFSAALDYISRAEKRNDDTFLNK